MSKIVTKNMVDPDGPSTHNTATGLRSSFSTRRYTGCLYTLLHNYCFEKNMDDTGHALSVWVNDTGDMPPELIEAIQKLPVVYGENTLTCGEFFVYVAEDSE